MGLGLGMGVGVVLGDENHTMVGSMVGGVVSLVHAGHWEIARIGGGKEGTSGHCAVGLHGCHRERIVQVSREVVDVDGLRGGVTVAHGGGGDGDWDAVAA